MCLVQNAFCHVGSEGRAPSRPRSRCSVRCLNGSDVLRWGQRTLQPLVMSSEAEISLIIFPEQMISNWGPFLLGMTGRGIGLLCGRFRNPALRREINRKTAKPMTALVMFACDRSEPGATMRIRCRLKRRTAGIVRRQC